MEQKTVYKVTQGPFRYQAWPTVCRDENDVLYAVCSGHRVGHICPFGKNLMFISRDGGDTWSVPMIVNDSYLDDRDAGICYLGNGNMILSYFCHPMEFLMGEREWLTRETDEYSRDITFAAVDTYRKFTPEMNAYGSFVKFSHDYGMTWSDSVKVPITSPHGPVKTASGRLLWLGKEFHSGQYETGEIFLFESSDEGRTWEKRAMLQRPEGKTTGDVHEPDLIELPDGELLGAIRVGKGNDFTMYLYRSRDGGTTWDAPTATGICGSPPHLALLHDGTLLLTYTRRLTPCGVRAVAVGEGGRTFGKEIVLTESQSPDLGYPSTVELTDGTLVTVYYQRGTGDLKTSIFATKWRLGE